MQASNYESRDNVLKQGLNAETENFLEKYSSRMFLINTFPAAMLNSSQIPFILKGCNSAQKPVLLTFL